MSPFYLNTTSQTTDVKTNLRNLLAFHLGRISGLFFRGLVDNGMSSLNALKLCGKLTPTTIDPSQAETWAKNLGTDDEKLNAVLAVEEEISCDQAATFA